jgi:uncharacterized membrane protein YdbT with pleckstrin-like domain
MEYERTWKKTLGPNESVKHEFSIGKRYRMAGLIIWCVIGALFLFGLAPLGIFIILVAAFYYGFYLKAANAYAFTEHRVLVHRGWLSTKMISTDYSKITDVTVHEPFFSRILFHTGKIEIDTAGTNRQDVVLNHIEHPYEVKKKLDELRHHTV